MQKLALAFFLMITCGPASAQLPVAVAVVGAGTAGNWVTEIAMANPTDHPLTVQLSSVIPYISILGLGCPLSEPGSFATIPANGTITVPDSGIPECEGVPPGVLHTVYIVSFEYPDVVPVVRARARNTINPQLTTELPTVRMGTIAALGATTLYFPSATRTADTHVNLVIASIVPVGGGVTFSARVEAYSSDGTLLGGMNVLNRAGPEGYAPNIFLVDVLAQLGVTSLADGQIKVTKLSGDGVLWGGMAVVYPAGVVALSPGVNP